MCSSPGDPEPHSDSTTARLQVNFQMQTGCGGFQCSGEIVEAIELRVSNYCRDSRRVRFRKSASSRGGALRFSSSTIEPAMNALVVHASQVLTPHEAIPDGIVVVEDGKITAVGHRDEVEIPAGADDCVATGMTVVPGFVDLHIHGAGGHDVMQGTPEALRQIAETVARFGTTSIVATTVTASPEETMRSLAAIANYIYNGQTLIGARAIPAAEILGIHLEGPFISKLRTAARACSPSRLNSKVAWN
jgi:hypothetical protein